jgi:hypothetical protein
MRTLERGAPNACFPKSQRFEFRLQDSYQLPIRCRVPVTCRIITYQLTLAVQKLAHLRRQALPIHLFLWSHPDLQVQGGGGNIG